MRAHKIYIGNLLLLYFFQVISIYLMTSFKFIETCSIEGVNAFFSKKSLYTLSFLENEILILNSKIMHIN